MANYEIRLSLDELMGDSSPEVMVEFWNSKLNRGKGDMQFISFVTSSGRGKGYDTVRSQADADGDGILDARDNTLLIALANAFVGIDTLIKKKKVKKPS
ncbi:MULTISPECIES: hypothetical protein [Pseudomonas syringae group]|uniref:Uncharacterized protein n=1 Tax=Pseudomonas syringae pv. coriandricola TaxID=264453 RepID=A0A0P9L3C4_9PSED|nr:MULTISPECIES: hypothetical protein [Pseudomonas syringae group]KPW70933.1 Uncharacterized protein ALO76_02050 [Pseudomonas syringae pv. coriandricola]RMN08678.1 hypothetical protein ALQ65_01311 [Pseudomonas syringae pv. coriandricola]